MSKAKVFAIAVLVIGMAAAEASAQIIATSIPRLAPGESGGSRYAFHFLVAPVAKWNYGEAYYWDNKPNTDGWYNTFTGTTNSRPSSKILIAADAAIKLREPWSVGVGGWWNKIGTMTHNVDTSIAVRSVDRNDIVVTPYNYRADFGGRLEIYEGHASLYYRDYGIQAGVVRTKVHIDKTHRHPTIYDRQTRKVVEDRAEDIVLEPFDLNTTDWDIFAVYRKSGGTKLPWVASAGVGTYFKEGTIDTPLRQAGDRTLLTSFLTARVEVYKGLGVDASYWYIGPTGDTWGYPHRDTQTRFSLGIGYTFAR